MEWKKFETEDIYWRKIAELLTDRLKLVDGDLRDPAKTETLVDVRILQREREDIVFFLTLPTIFSTTPDMESEDATVSSAD